MATKTINDLPELTSPASGDFVATWDISGVSTNKLTLANIYNLFLTQSNTFSALQSFAPSATNIGAIALNMPVNTVAAAISGTYNGVQRAVLNMLATQTVFSLSSVDLGQNTAGPQMLIGYNNNATVPAAGTLRMVNRSGTTSWLWIDAAGKLRIAGAPPTTAVSDTSGTVVGTQT